MNDEEMYVEALELATHHHAGQKRKDGQDYITHPIAVARLLTTYKLKTIALLHDVIEDTNCTNLTLIIKHFPQDVIDAVMAISKIEGEDYVHYLGRVLRNPLARKVKIADITHNLSDLGKGNMRDKYMIAREVLENERIR